ncbi:hypothetical protein, partial [Neisseria dentiae]|uniref:hypothetical protein n=1 Tax=Neisseria dentiae TaxID=194197 RepID=UPI0035A13A97
HQVFYFNNLRKNDWIPACAGMTMVEYFRRPKRLAKVSGWLGFGGRKAVAEESTYVIPGLDPGMTELLLSY